MGVFIIVAHLRVVLDGDKTRTWLWLCGWMLITINNISFTLWRNLDTSVPTMIDWLMGC